MNDRKSNNNVDSDAAKKASVLVMWFIMYSFLVLRKQSPNGGSLTTNFVDYIL